MTIYPVIAGLLADHLLPLLLTHQHPSFFKTDLFRNHKPTVYCLGETLGSWWYLSLREIDCSKINVTSAPSS